jgi:hypothetical protein
LLREKRGETSPPFKVNSAALRFDRKKGRSQVIKFFRWLKMSGILPLLQLRISSIHHPDITILNIKRQIRIRLIQA